MCLARGDGNEQSLFQHGAEKESLLRPAPAKRHNIASEPGAEQFGRHAAEHGVAHSGHRGRAFIAGGCAVGAVGQADHKAHQCHFTR